MLPLEMRPRRCVVMHLRSRRSLDGLLRRQIQSKMWECRVANFHRPVRSTNLTDYQKRSNLEMRLAHPRKSLVELMSQRKTSRSLRLAQSMP